MSERPALRIALLEDDPEQSAKVSGWIEDRGYMCAVYSSAEEFQRAFRKSSYDVIILDWMLTTGSSGLEVLNWVRKTLTSDIPIIFATSRQAEEDIVTALQAGADDYLAKPVRQHELMARLYALARRAQPESEVLNWVRKTLTSDIPIIFATSRQAEEDIVTALQAGADDYLAKPVRQHELMARLYALARRAQPESEVLECPPYVFNTANREVKLNDEPIKLTEKEYELALFLFRNRGRVLSRQHLLTSVWGTSAELNTRTVDTHASRLRKKLNLLATERWKLTSIYQHGYRLEEHTSPG